jgi:hypothetical protein
MLRGGGIFGSSSCLHFFSSLSSEGTNRKKDSFWLPTVVEKSPIVMATLRKGILMSIIP